MGSVNSTDGGSRSISLRLCWCGGCGGGLKFTRTEGDVNSPPAEPPDITVPHRTAPSTLPWCLHRAYRDTCLFSAAPTMAADAAVLVTLRRQSSFSH
eukprot:7267029-Prymnesium_polylepis.1